MKGNSEVLEEEERRLVRSEFAGYNNNKMKEKINHYGGVS